ncbi:hypothetical protein E4U54_001666, partial [Claviceps lovelessii]
ETSKWMASGWQWMAGELFVGALTETMLFGGGGGSMRAKQLNARAAAPSQHQHQHLHLHLV